MGAASLSIHSDQSLFDDLIGVLASQRAHIDMDTDGDSTGESAQLRRALSVEGGETTLQTYIQTLGAVRWPLLTMLLFSCCAFFLWT